MTAPPSANHNSANPTADPATTKGAVRIRTGVGGFAGPCLATRPRRRLVRSLPAESRIVKARAVWSRGGAQPSGAMAGRSPLAALLVGLAAAAIAGAPPVTAQDQDARLPETGQLWFQMTGVLLNWNSQFAEGSDSILDGEREPLTSHFDGDLSARLYPSAYLSEDFNVGAAALGIPVLEDGDLTLGDMGFSTMRAQERVLGLGLEYGVFDWLSVGLRAPFRHTDVETTLHFDSTTAAFTWGDLAIENQQQFLNGSADALTQLQALIDGGALVGPDLEAASALLAGSQAFFGAISDMAQPDRVFPVRQSLRGLLLLANLGQLQEEFGALGISLPDMDLVQLAGEANLMRIFEDGFIRAEVPGRARNGISVGALEFSARLRAVDQISRRGEDRGPGLFRFRTAVGGLVRMPTRDPNGAPIHDPDNFLDIPVASGHPELELTLYQDVLIGKTVFLRFRGQYTMRQPVAAVLRVAPPDQPYAHERLKRIMNIYPGDVLALQVRPSLLIAQGFSAGLDYDYYSVPATSYELIEPLEGLYAGIDASELSLETTQTRHRIGLGFVLDMTEARGRASDRTAGPTRNPWQFAVSIRRAFSGSGGRTPTSHHFSVAIRTPIALF